MAELRAEIVLNIKSYVYNIRSEQCAVTSWIYGFGATVNDNLSLGVHFFLNISLLYHKFFFGANLSHQCWGIVWERRGSINERL